MNPQTPIPEDHDDKDEGYRAVDRLWSAQRGRLTGGLSPAALALAFID